MERFKYEVYDAWCQLKGIWHLSDLELMVDICAMYSKKHWLILLDERLKRYESDY